MIDKIVLTYVLDNVLGARAGFETKNSIHLKGESDVQNIKEQGSKDKGHLSD